MITDLTTLSSLFAKHASGTVESPAPEASVGVDTVTIKEDFTP